MFLWIAEQLGFPGVLNLFRYITFRAGAATATALVHRPADRPEVHRLAAGAPGQGPADPRRRAAIAPRQARHADHGRADDPDLADRRRCCCGWTSRNRYLWACLFITVGFGLIGFLDDYDKVTKRSHKGVSGRTRLLAEFVVAGIGCWIITWGAGTELYIPFYNGPVVDLGLFYIVFAAFVVVAFGNAVNLTDGLDGLATMPVIIASLAFLVISYLVGNAVFAAYLGIPLRAGRRAISPCSARRSSAPASPSSGSTRRRRRSSWAIPAASRWAARSARSPSRPSTRSCSGSSAACSSSRRCRVIIQVFFYKRTGKRVFKMAPIHHHFEQIGWSEPTVVIRFWIISFVLALAGLSTLKLR